MYCILDLGSGPKLASLLRALSGYFFATLAIKSFLLPLPSVTPSSSKAFNRKGREVFAKFSKKS
jgi:archaeosine-15-forming tRNA-guanine transglycosylase